MSSRCRSAALALAAVVLLAGCDREERLLRSSPRGSSTTPTVRQSGLLPGPTGTSSDSLPPERVTDSIVADTFVTDSLPRRRLYPLDESPYENVAHAISEGKQLFDWMNCSGCHASGGGAIGPALMDDQWIYGSAPQNIYTTIVEGRPNGMPSFGGRLTDDQVWQLVAYVRSLNALPSKAARSGRSDDIMLRKSEQRLPKPPVSKRTREPEVSRPEDAP